jgi:hypothetical protein
MYILCLAHPNDPHIPAYFLPYTPQEPALAKPLVIGKPTLVQICVLP